MAVRVPVYTLILLSRQEDWQHSFQTSILFLLIFTFSMSQTCSMFALVCFVEIFNASNACNTSSVEGQKVTAFIFMLGYASRKTS